jgi:endo-1,4-beta-mannosidase
MLNSLQIIVSCSTSSGVPDPTALAAFDWLLDEVEALGGVKLMMTLTNCLADYGGMQQYVRWGTCVQQL